MNRRTFSKFRTWALTGVAIAAIAGPAWAEEARQFQIPQQSLVAALEAFGKQGDKEILFSRSQAEGHATAGVVGKYEPQQALAMLLNGSGLKFRQVNDNTYVVEASDPQSGSAAGDGAEGTVAALIVTAQKKEEQIQDVPIAISAFSEKTLQEQKIEGGFDLLKAIPNVTFSKNNFSSYNFSIRGIGTKAVSVTTDPGVAVEFNSTTLIRNRLFEQEYFDIERVEVLRGPQGTLHGRNATAGVINVISAKPTDRFEGAVKAEVGNYQSRRASGFVNVPIVGDKLAVRIAGSFTDRNGYDYNSRTQHPVNGRNLWSGRVTVGFRPIESLKSYLIWEHFDENDNRSRTGKQLCHRDPGRTEIDGVPVVWPFGARYNTLTQAQFSQGCKPGSLYNDDAFGTPNGLSIPFIAANSDLRSGAGPIGYTVPPTTVSYSPRYGVLPIAVGVDPYGGMMQSRDLRVIDSVRDPIYRAKADVVELNIDFDVTPQLTFTSQTAYDKDQVYSFQDYNRFNTVPIFNDSSALFGAGTPITGRLPNPDDPSPLRTLLKGGIYCDPQIGCSDSLAGFDISQAKSSQFSQEIRLASSFDGRFNFSVGAGYTRYKTLEDYYVLYNLITLTAQTPGPLNTFNFSADVNKCLPRRVLDGFVSSFADLSQAPVSLDDPRAQGCIYIDPNPVDKINGDGHNYFRSKNPYRLSSAAAFGELYWQVRPDLKVTAGLRYTDDRKIFTPVPSQVLLSSSPILSGTVDRGYPALPDIKQRWGELTGRLGVDWKPQLSFTDQSMIYAFYSRGYKGGGANPPGIGFSTAPCAPFGGTPEPGTPPCNQVLSYPAVFRPEFVNAFEIGSKNTLLGGALVLNGDTFFYDYKDYQISQIKDRTAVNENFDARVWGAELEMLFQPTRNLRFNGAFGYEQTRLADSARSIDLMDRTAGDPNFIVVKPWIQLASNCVAPKSVVLDFLQQNRGIAGICPGSPTSVLSPDDYAAFPNGGAGIYKNLGGNELPNAPHWTVSLGGQQSWDVLEQWRVTLRADAYWQAQSWARVYNDNPYDKLHGWYNANLSLWVERPEDGLKIEIYAKNILNKTPITDAFLNSDDTALTTNVFVLDPRLIGLSIKKDF